MFHTNNSCYRSTVDSLLSSPLLLLWPGVLVLSCSPLQLLGVFHRFSNMKLIRTLSLLVALASAALADVEFLEPDAGATAKGGDTITVRWRDSGKEPKLSQLTRYDLYLCAGGDTADSYVS